MRRARPPRLVVDGIDQHVDEQAGHLDAERAEDDASDPALGLHDAARLDRHHLPDDRATGRSLNQFLTATDPSPPLHRDAIIEGRWVSEDWLGLRQLRLTESV